MKPEINENKIVVFTGAGISAESGLQTFRDSDGLWNRYKISEVATVDAWLTNPELVLQFYNERKSQVLEAKPNAAHVSIVELEKKYEVVVITQNIDDLHERAGSAQVVHLHGEIRNARSSIDSNLIYQYDEKPILIGDMCEQGSQLRPHIVLFGESIENYALAVEHIKTAKRVLVVGTSLTVYPAAGMLDKVRNRAEKIIVAYELESRPYGFQWLRGKASELVPGVVDIWLDGKTFSIHQ